VLKEEIEPEVGNIQNEKKIRARTSGTFPEVELGRITIGPKRIKILEIKLY
jgi:hypothetical protein